MTIEQLYQILDNYPDTTEIRLMVNQTNQVVQPLNDDHILLTSETAFVNQDAPEDEWDTEDGKVELGGGKKYLLINPIIL